MTSTTHLLCRPDVQLGLSRQDPIVFTSVRRGNGPSGCGKMSAFLDRSRCNAWGSIALRTIPPCDES